MAERDHRGVVGKAPSELAAFIVRLVQAVPKGEPPTAVFAIACKDCRGDRFAVSERIDIEGEGETPLGIVLECATCHHSRDLFDMRRNGYDGQFGHWDQLKGAITVRPLNDPAAKALLSVRVRSSYLYNIDFDELRELAAEARRPTQDFYDWFILEAQGDAAWTQVWDCECA